MHYTWRPAILEDVVAITNMTNAYMRSEIEPIFEADVIVYSRNITTAILNQQYIPLSESLGVAYDYTNTKLLAYTWIKGYERAPWSDDYVAMVRMAQVDMSLSTTKRYKLISDMMLLWERYANLAKNKVICSTSVRCDQDNFMALHRRRGYDVRGSYAYKRLT